MNERVTNLFGGKRRVVCFAIVLLLIAGGLIWFINRSREPVYEGKSLTYWLNCYAPLNRTETSAQEADHAIQAIGTKAIPTLLKMLQKTDLPLKIRLVALLRKQHFIKIRFHPASYYNEIALAGFHALGNSGRPAVPKLINLLKQPGTDSSKINILIALSAIGPAAETAVPCLLELLTETDVSLPKVWVIASLGEIHAHPEIAVPALIKCLESQHLGVRQGAVKALGQFGTAAQQAIPALQDKSHDNDPGTRTLALIALRQIDNY